MNNWKKYKLEQISSKLGDGLHGTPIYDENGEYFFINGSNLVRGRIVTDSNTKRVKKDQYDKYKKDLSDRTILLGINGTIGNVALFNKEKCILGKSACYLNVDDKFDKNFIKYVLLNDDFQSYIKANATGSVIKNVGLKLLREYEVVIPSDIETQSRIASILSSLDDKIELNRRMNQTLEQMSQALFNHYFVDNIDPDNLPEGWRNGKIKQIAKSNLKTLSKSDILLKIDYVEISEVNRGSIGNITTYVRGKEPSRARRILSHGDTVMSTVRPDRGAYFLAINPYKELIVSTGFAVFSPFEVPYTFLFLLLTQPDLIKYYGFVANGAAYPSISAETICDMDIVLPEKELLEEFHKKVEPLLLNFNLNINESKILSNIRDTLLPKLMSGEIDVETLMKEEELIPNELVENLKTA